MIASRAGWLLETDAPAEVGFPVVADLVGAGGARDLAVEVLVLADALVEADAVFEPGIAAGGGAVDRGAVVGGGHAGVAVELVEAGELEIDIAVFGAASGIDADAGDERVYAVVPDKGAAGAAGVHGIGAAVEMAVVQLDLRL